MQKLHWDALAIVLVQGDRLDRDYLAKTAAEARLDDLLGRVLDEAGARGD